MIDIILLIIFLRKNSKKAQFKGYPDVWGIFITIILYIVGEILGILTGLALSNSLGEEYFILIFLLGFVGGVSGGIISLIIVSKLKPKPNPCPNDFHKKKPKPFLPEEPDATWCCPKCSEENKNSSFKCLCCGYQIQ